MSDKDLPANPPTPPEPSATPSGAVPPAGFDQPPPPMPGPAPVPAPVPMAMPQPVVMPAVGVPVQPIAYAAPVVQLAPMSGLAVTGFVLSLLGMLGGFFVVVFPLVGLILSILGIKATANPMVARGRGLAIAGVVLGGIGMLFVVLWAIPWLVVVLGSLGVALGAAS